MIEIDFTKLIDEIKTRQTMIKSYLSDERNRISFNYKHLEHAVYSYINAGGKSLRPAVLMFCCGAVGGDEKSAIPAAAAIELYHTFTLVHDDIIDNDELRRGVPTVHHEFAQRAASELNMEPDKAQHYGMAIAILAGDVQQGWAASLLPDLHFRHGIPAELALYLVQDLFYQTQVNLINGETLDIVQAEMPVDQLTEEHVLEMLWQKTGTLYEFAGRAGAAIGLRAANVDHPVVQKIAQFTGKCGVAFQLQDDILGVIGDEDKLGKTVGSDIREGKRTVILLHSLKNMTPAQREFTLNVLGHETASEEDIRQVTDLLRSAGGIEHTRQLAESYITEAMTYLDELDDTPYKELLSMWARYIVARSF